MAVVTPTFTNIYGVTGGIDAIIVSWATMGDSDTATPVQLPDRVDRSFQVEGTFGGATMKLTGSNDGTNYEQLTNPAGTAIGLTAAGIQQVTEATLWVKPATSSGSGSSLTATMCMRRTVR